MKKLSIFFICLVLCLSLSAVAYADEQNADMEGAAAEQTTVDASQPRLMVTSYKLSQPSVTPSGNTTLEITMKNYSATKALKNIKLSLIDESGEIRTQGMPTAYVDHIYAGSTYVWELSLTAAKTAAIGEHKLTFTAEFEDKYYNAYSASDNISITVTQTPNLDFDGVQLPVKVTQGDTQTVTVKLMNTGKANLRNCKVDFAVDGFESAGTLFVGEIPAGESKDGSTNLRISTDVLGEVKGKAVVSYEDDLGEVYTKEVEVTSLIEEKVEIAETEEEEEKAKYPMWWLFMLIGLAVGGGIGCAVPVIIHSNKQRKEDELRL